jgi:hypothetical protein
MPTAPWITCFWPGLSRLWFRGQWRGLVSATIFAGFVNYLLLTSFLWPELVSPTIRSAMWFLAVGVWVASAWGSFRHLPQLLKSGGVIECDTLFQQAQSEYLKGHWYEAETLLAQRLQVDGRDVDSRLMLATLYRHTGRYDQAKSALATLQRMESAEKWEFEINQELQLLRSKKEDLSRASPTQAQTDPQVNDAA